MIIEAPKIEETRLIQMSSSTINLTLHFTFMPQKQVLVSHHQVAVEAFKLEERRGEERRGEVWDSPSVGALSAMTP